MNNLTIIDFTEELVPLKNHAAITFVKVALVLACLLLAVYCLFKAFYKERPLTEKEIIDLEYAKLKELLTQNDQNYSEIHSQITFLIKRIVFAYFTINIISKTDQEIIKSFNKDSVINQLLRSQCLEYFNKVQENRFSGNPIDKDYLADNLLFLEKFLIFVKDETKNGS